MQIKKDIRQISGSYYLPLPPVLVKYLKLEHKSSVLIEDFIYKGTKIIQFWKEGDDNENSDTIN